MPDLIVVTRNTDTEIEEMGYHVLAQVQARFGAGYTIHNLGEKDIPPDHRQRWDAVAGKRVSDYKVENQTLVRK